MSGESSSTRVDDALRALDSALDQVAALDLSAPGVDRRDLLRELAARQRRLDSVVHDTVADFDAHQDASLDGSASSGAWLRANLANDAGCGSGSGAAGPSGARAPGDVGGIRRV
jgi:hypothetical protein